MPKRHQQHPAKEVRGHNNPEKTTEPVRAHAETDLTKKQDSRARMAEGEHRSGSDSNAHGPRKKSRMHEGPEKQPAPQPKETYNFEKDLRPHNFAGADYGPRSEPVDIGLRAADIKELYGKLADLTKDEMREIVIIPAGERLEQGATYIDLAHLERGELVATADMVAEEGHYYVPKNRMDYVLWNRLRQVDEPERLDER